MSYQIDDCCFHYECVPDSCADSECPEAECCAWNEETVINQVDECCHQLQCKCAPHKCPELTCDPDCEVLCEPTLAELESGSKCCPSCCAKEIELTCLSSDSTIYTIGQTWDVVHNGLPEYCHFKRCDVGQGSKTATKITTHQADALKNCVAPAPCGADEIECGPEYRDGCCMKKNCIEKTCASIIDSGKCEEFAFEAFDVVDCDETRHERKVEVRKGPENCCKTAICVCIPQEECPEPTCGACEVLKGTRTVGGKCCPEAICETALIKCMHNDNEVSLGTWTEVNTNNQGIALPERCYECTCSVDEDKACGGKVNCKWVDSCVNQTPAECAEDEIDCGEQTIEGCCTKRVCVPKTCEKIREKDHCVTFEMGNETAADCDPEQCEELVTVYGGPDNCCYKTKCECNYVEFNKLPQVCPPGTIQCGETQKQKCGSLPICKPLETCSANGATYAIGAEWNESVNGKPAICRSCKCVVKEGSVCSDESDIICTDNICLDPPANCPTGQFDTGVLVPSTDGCCSERCCAENRCKKIINNGACDSFEPLATSAERCNLGACEVHEVYTTGESDCCKAGRCKCDETCCDSLTCGKCQRTTGYTEGKCCQEPICEDIARVCLDQSNNSKGINDIWVHKQDGKCYQCGCEDLDPSGCKLSRYCNEVTCKICATKEGLQKTVEDGPWNESHEDPNVPDTCISCHCIDNESDAVCVDRTDSCPFTKHQRMQEKCADDEVDLGVKVVDCC
jgi:hypothetical protein